MSNEATIKQLYELHSELSNFMATGQQIQNKIVNIICDLSSGKATTSGKSSTKFIADKTAAIVEDMKHVQRVSGITERNPEICTETENMNIGRGSHKDDRVINQIVVDNISNYSSYLYQKLPKGTCNLRDIQTAIFGVGGNEGSFVSYVKNICAPDIDKFDWADHGYGTRGGRTPSELPRLRFIADFANKSKFKLFLNDTKYFKRLAEAGKSRFFDENGNEAFYTDIIIESFKDEYEEYVQKLLSNEYVKKHGS